MNLLLDKISRAIAADIHCTPAQAAAAVNLLEEGATVPFIARYRKEVTGGLDDTQLRALEEKLIYLKDLEDRRASILESIEKQGKLTDALRAEIESADSKQRLEDLYLPYKPKRRTRLKRPVKRGLSRSRISCSAIRRWIPRRLPRRSFPKPIRIRPRRLTVPAISRRSVSRQTLS